MTALSRPSDTETCKHTWILGARGLKALKDGLCGFIEDNIIKCRDQILDDILKSQPSNSSRICNVCTVDDILPDHCKENHKDCVHRSRNACRGRCRNNRRKCPNNICSVFYDKIVLSHTNTSPNFNNTDLGKWCTDSNGWNYAKCFQTTTNQNSSAKETDASGILAIIINNIGIHQFLECKDVSAENSPFKKALDIRNIICHNVMAEIEESDLRNYFETFIEVLQDKKCLINDERAKAAVIELQTLASMARTGDEENEKARIPPKFKDDLIQWYIKYMVSLPLSITKDTTFESLYVKQELLERTEGNLKRIESLKSLFTSKGKGALEIFLCSNVGAGKTTFAKYLTSLWCQSHCPSTDHNDVYQEEDLKALRDIDFVFPLNLTDSLDTGLCNTEDMIYQQIIQNLPCRSSFVGNESPLKTILESKRCLIILDDSDRWQHPSNQCTKTFKGIPHRFATDNVIVLTIARERHLVKMNNSQIDKVIEIGCLGNQSIKQLQINAMKEIAELSNKPVNKKELESQQQEFQNMISRHNLDKLVCFPIFSIHLVCLWCVDKMNGMSEYKVYGRIIEMLLSRTLKKIVYFQSTNFIQLQESGYTELLDGLGNLTSHSYKEGKTIARSSVKKCLNEEHVKLCLISGILSESNGKSFLEENNSEIIFTFENMREHFRQRLQKRE